MGRKVGSDFPRRRIASGNTMFKVTVSVSRNTHSRAVGTYTACAIVDTQSRKRIPSRAGMSVCANGSAPRRATAKALTALSKVLIKRSSAFRGA